MLVRIQPLEQERNNMLHCQCCKQAQSVSTSNLEEKIKQSGFLPVFTDAGGILFFCGNCAREIAKHVTIIQELAGDEEHWMNWRSLGRLKESIEKYKEFL